MLLHSIRPVPGALYYRHITALSARFQLHATDRPERYNHYLWFDPSRGAGVAQRLCNGLSRDGRGSIPGGDGVKTELHVLRKGQ